MAEVEAALERVKTQLGAADHELFRRLVNTLQAVTGILNSSRAMLARLRRLFGLSSSEKTKAVLAAQNPEAPESPPEANDSASGAPASPSSELPAGAKKSKGHGRLSASEYQAATHVDVPHPTLRIGDVCPACTRGKLFELSEPAQYLRIFGQPVLAARCWNCQRLRCSGCGAVHTAVAPPEAQGPKFHETAVAMIALCRYGVGVPHNRLARMQRYMKLPVPASTQWEVIRDNAAAFEPVFAELERHAAQGELLHADDTHARILAFMGERRAELLRNGELPSPDRVGLFTTGVVALVKALPILLFYTGRKYAGENLDDLLEARDVVLGPPLLMSDGLESRNVPADSDVIESNCLSHARRGVVDQVVNFPDQCRHVLLLQLREVYRVDADCKELHLSPEERLVAHQERSAPVMASLKEWLEAELLLKRVEPNSDLGKAYKYMLKRWDKLTVFLRQAGAPLDNNICERALKMAIRHRRNSLFYFSERGAEIGDMFMSLIYTAELRGENPFHYLTAILQNEKAVAESPGDWLPWTYQATLARVVNPSRAP